jgi:hypothetical protein
MGTASSPAPPAAAASAEGYYAPAATQSTTQNSDEVNLLRAEIADLRKKVSTGSRR